MSGLIFLVALAVVLWACVWVSRKLGDLIPNQAWRGVVKVSAFLALLAAPFVDEVIGMYQFESLCETHGIESADVSKARGKKVKFEYSDREAVKKTIMPILVSDVLFRDIDNGEILIRHKNYLAMGGWLMRYTPVSMGSPQPMLFDGNGCGLNRRSKIFAANQISEVN